MDIDFVVHIRFKEADLIIRDFDISLGRTVMIYVSQQNLSCTYQRKVEAIEKIVIFFFISSATLDRLERYFLSIKLIFTNFNFNFLSLNLITPIIFIDSYLITCLFNICFSISPELYILFIYPLFCLCLN
jgi:hypothetical protein